MYDFLFQGIDQSAFNETAKELLKDDIDSDTFIAEMIKTHFQDADIEIIQKMWEWAEYPMLEIVDCYYLRLLYIKKGIYCNECRLNFNIDEIIKSIESLRAVDNHWIPCLNCSGTIMASYHYMVNIKNSSEYCLIKPKMKFVEIIERSIFKDVNSLLITYHACCTNIIHSLWSKTNNMKLSSQLQDLTDEVQRLKRKNEALEYQLESKQYELRRLTSKVNKIEQHLPTEIVEYDYEAIKERLNPIRDELNIVQRTFRRIIHAQYKVPIAVLVGKN